VSDEYKFHPLAAIFPPMSEDEFLALVEDIKKHGLRQPIILDDKDQIIEGRHRYRACKRAGVPPRFENRRDVGNVGAFIVSVNLHRRHLDASQKAMAAARFKAFMKGEDWRSIVLPEAEKSPANLQRVEDITKSQHTQSETVAAAEVFKVSPRSVASADVVVAKGVPELADAVD
jgi:hypothetical protein